MGEVICILELLEARIREFDRQCSGRVFPPDRLLQVEAEARRLAADYESYSVFYWRRTDEIIVEGVRNRINPLP